MSLSTFPRRTAAPTIPDKSATFCWSALKSGRAPASALIPCCGFAEPLEDASAGPLATSLGACAF